MGLKSRPQVGSNLEIKIYLFLEIEKLK